jgi:hypothetical protein
MSRTASGVELLHARYVRRTFPRHFHDEYILGVMEEGSEVLEVENRTFTAVADRIPILNPGQVHAPAGGARVCVLRAILE